MRKLPDIKYISTRGDARPRGFVEAMLAGLAEDGGLFVPDGWPQLAEPEISDLAGRRYEEIAERVMRPFVGDDFSGSGFREHVEAAYSGFAHGARCPLVQVGPNMFLLELFHGPTLAFKDFAMQLVGRLFQAVLERQGRRATIIGATSGDTGSAAIEAFRGMGSVDVFILFPDGRVSEIQRRQMTTATEDNVHAVAVAGDFDDCQALVKAMFNDSGFRDRMKLAAVNSINWARVLAQTVYYFAAATALGAPRRRISFSVPTGNFGDIYSGYVARRMGLPIEVLAIATNQNDILHRALSTGGYRMHEVKESFSPSMDIQVSSNFERALFDACDRDAESVRGMMSRVGSGGFDIGAAELAKLRAQFSSGSCTESETLAVIGSTRDRTGLVVCPHTAVGLKVAEEVAGPPDVPVVALATAHPAKFPDAVERACGVRPALPHRMADIGRRPERVCRVPNDLEAVQRAIIERSSL